MTVSGQFRIASATAFLLGPVACSIVIGQVAESGWKPPASFETLPSTRGLPDVLVGADGRRIVDRAGWSARRDEIKSLIQYYQYGRMPPRPDEVRAEVTDRKPHASGQGTEEWVTLVIGSERRLRMRAVLYLPEGDGPHPVVIREEGTLGRTKQVPMFLDAGYMFIEYARHDLDPDRRGVVGPAQKAYPDYDWATLSVWAWGGMRVVDYLESRDDVDRDKIAITGHSRGGKMALLAGALDERFALVVPNGSGAGGAGSYRILGPGAESLGMNDKPWWYHERIRWFAEKEDRLPFDQHFLKALVAPRALLCTESVDDEFANPEGTQASSVAGLRVHRFLNATEKTALRYRRGKHASNDEDWRALLEFAEWQFFGRAPENPKEFWQTPYTLSSVSGDEATAEAAIPENELRLPRAQDAFLSFAEVAHPGNAADLDHYGTGAYGRVAHVYGIGTREVTNEQYAVFLNAVARKDPHSLYHVLMARGPDGGIVRSGEEGEYRYRVRRSTADRPVHFVSWYDAIRFANWLHNGRPQGEQGAGTTEDGAYDLKRDPESITRRPAARFALASEDEWYKAAYWVPAEPAHYALFQKVRSGRSDPIRYELDAKAASGAERMFDKTWEWNEAAVGKLFRGLRSGAWFLGNNRQSAGRFYSNPELELRNVGFRVVELTGAGS